MEGNDGNVVKVTVGLAHISLQTLMDDGSCGELLYFC